MKNSTNEFIPAQGQGNKNIEDDIDDITISNDGSWQKCGHSSLNGVVTVVASDSAKCVDFFVYLQKLVMHIPLGKNEKAVNQNYMNNLWKHIIVQ